LILLLSRLDAAQTPSRAVTQQSHVSDGHLRKTAFRGASVCAVTSDYASAAGANPVESVFDESWAYTSERSHRPFDEMIPPPTRKIACRLTVTYAGFEDESTLLRELYKRGLQQPQVGTDLYAGDGILMFWSHTPVAPWQDEAWLAEMRRSLRPAQYLRMIENRFVTSEGSFVNMGKWDQIVDPRLAPLLNDPTLPVYIGVDAGFKHDQTAIIAALSIRPRSKYAWYFVGYFSPVLMSRSTSKLPSNGRCASCANASRSAKSCLIHGKWKPWRSACSIKACRSKSFRSHRPI
jgi:hypothetical protein